MKSLCKGKSLEFIINPLKFCYMKNRQYSTNISNYCLETVKKHDYENFLATLLLPQAARDSVFAIRAFNSEIAQIKDVTSQETIGKMRIQFWKDTLNNIYSNKPPNQPIAKALHKAKEKHNLSKKWFKNMIESREDDLVGKFCPNIEALESYAEKSNAALYYLILQCVGVQNINADHAASHIGKSEGIVKVIRGIPHHGAKRVVTIPINLLAQHRVSEEDIVRGKREQKVKDVIYDLASVAFQHLEHAKKLEIEIPTEARIALMPAVGVANFLRRLQLAHFDIFDSKLQKRNPLLGAKLWWAVKIKRSYK